MSKANVPVLKQPKPKRKNSKKITGILILLCLSLLAVLFFRSSLSKISSITFEGSAYTSEEKLLEISGLELGAPFFGTSSETIAKRMKKIPSIEVAEVDKLFPGGIMIRIKEYPLAAYELTVDDGLKGLLANGTKISLGIGSMPMQRPILTGWREDDPNLAKLCEALAQIPEEQVSDISEIVPSPTLSYPDRVKLYTGSKFEVVTAISLLPAKLEYMNFILESQDPGILTMLEADSYVPYEPHEEQNDTTHE
ncbi:cell division protein FtsQ/DivIB [Paenibacillus lentus]|uniref:FtsQ-type POTRA domain-containing protein n=1 Tax=Paenibacillus lentus TaxID=1338368 RepID=A0A3Q8SBM4_9BACL|nr:FtsQ-type POTRA domain-containing protein [Paenibacillus lentus]AZK46892.1 FtsQ-type POTRA domain-containing protein [Paenibacillus lentus]